MAPSGSGWARWSALGAFHWSTQGPVQHSVAVPVRGLSAPQLAHRGVTPVYVYRPNQRRLDLNWGEATLLDAVRSYDGRDEYISWDDALLNLLAVHPDAIESTVIERDKVLWAAETERFRPKWPDVAEPGAFKSLIRRLQSDMPEVVPA